MKEILCNVTNPPLTKIALLTGHKLTGFRTGAGNVLECKLDGERMTTRDARAKMLQGYGQSFVFVNHLGYALTV